jgi:hypothetical protein
VCSRIFVYVNKVPFDLYINLSPQMSAASPLSAPDNEDIILEYIKFQCNDIAITDVNMVSFQKIGRLAYGVFGEVCVGRCKMDVWLWMHDGVFPIGADLLRFSHETLVKR